MNLKEIVLRVGGVGIMGIAFFAFFIGLIMILAPYEFEELHKKVNMYDSDKIVKIFDIAASKLLNETSLSEIKMFCVMRGAFNLNVMPSNNFSFTQEDIDFVCAQSNNAVSIDELKKSVVVYKFTQYSDSVFSETKNEILDPFLIAYTPIVFIIFFILYLISAFILYLSKCEITVCLRTITFHTFLYLIFYIAVFGICWIILPLVINSFIVQNPQFAQSLSDIDVQQKPRVEILISEGIILLIEWMRETLIHIIIIYAVLAFISGIAWSGCTIAYKAER